jgi:hypothetical protein
MQKRALKKFVGGKWEPLKWQAAQPGDVIRVYEKGRLSEDLDIKVLAPCDVVEIEGNWYAELLTDHGKINSKGLLSSRSVVRNPSKKKHRARAKKATPGG